MKEIKKFGAGNGKALKLTVFSSLGGTDQLSAIEPLWRILDASGLLGAFELSVRSSIEGVDGGAQVKVLGVGDNHAEVYVHFQSLPSNCFNGCVTGRNPEGRATPGSTINLALKDIAGFSWFDPDHPETKRTDTFHPAVPLVSVDKAMPPDANIPAPARDKHTRGVSRDLATSQLIFLKLAEKADVNRQIRSVQITDTIIAVTCKGDLTKNRHCAAPMMVAWKKKGWLGFVCKKSNVSVFRITDEAVKTFGLVFPSATTPSFASLQLADELPMLEDPNLVTNLQALRATAEKFQTAKATIKALRERRKEIMEEIEGLEVFVNDSRTHQAFALWSQISGVIAQAPAPKK